MPLLRYPSLLSLLVFAVSTLTPLTSARAEESHPGMDVESSYAEAAIAFNTRNYNQAIQLLGQILKVQPKNIQALELLALAQKTQGKDVESLKTYEALVNQKPENERAPYHFEIGTLYFKQKKYKESKSHLQKAAELDFNLSASLYFLGMASYQDGDLVLADYAFTRLIKVASGELEVAGHYFLGIVHARTGYTSGSTFELVAAKNLGTKLENNKVAHDLATAAIKSLAPYDKSRFFGSLAVIAQYDANVGLISDVASNVNPSGKATVKTNLNASLGWMSSPLKRFQVVISDRIAYNYNLNSLTKDYEFFSNTGSIFFNRDPLARTNIGLKLEGLSVVKNQKDTKGNYKLYPWQVSNLNAEIGPYYRTELMRRMRIGAEVGYRVLKFYNQAAEGDRTGTAITPRFNFSYDSTSAYWNPDANIIYDLYNSKGPTSKNRTLSFDVSNELKIFSKMRISPGFNLSLIKYPMTGRSDKTYTYRINLIRTLTNSMLLLADFNYSKNVSSDAGTFSYAKWATSMGVSFAL